MANSADIYAADSNSFDDSMEQDTLLDNVTINKGQSGSKRRTKISTLLCCTLKAAIAVISILLLVAISVGCGVGLGWYVFGEGQEHHSVHDSTLDWGNTVNDNGNEESIEDWLTGKLNAENIKNNLKSITAAPHIAGKDLNSQVTKLLYNTYSQYGFDTVHTTNYSVLLTYVNRSNPNTLQLMSGDGNTVIYDAHIRQETPLTEGEDSSDVPPPFNAYSAAGEATGRLVYVNYGQLEDFLYLINNLSLELSGHVCIVRYGQIFRGDKARLAQKYGCIGLLIYSDPADYAPKGGPPVYPNGPSLPPGGVQRGSVMITNGDPLTPTLPAIDGVQRGTYDDFVSSGGGPSIPVQPISYGDAIHFMNQLDSVPSPPSWKGEMNTSYMIYQSQDNTNMTTLKVNNIYEQREITNVYAVLYGTIEPDHLVILGNHYDAWTFGAVDPNGGTATILDVARVIGQLINTGWRPGRTIVLASWDCEEYGLIGSTEWIEDMEKLLGANTVAYLNVDVIVSGDAYFYAQATPLIFDVIYNATKKTACPCDDVPTLYDKWQKDTNMSEPFIYFLGSGSDFTYFVQNLGVTSCDMTYNYKGGSYPVYHSVHDNFYWAEHFGDPTFNHHVAVGEVWLRVAMAIATTPIVPFNPSRYYSELMNIYNYLEKTYTSTFKEHNVTLDLLEKCLADFGTAANNMSLNMEQYKDTQNLNILRIINNKLLNIERSFIIPEGLPGRPYFKHLILAPSSVNSYAGVSFSSVTDALFNATTPKDWRFVQTQLDTVAIHIRYATQVMNQPGVQWVK